MTFEILFTVYRIPILLLMLLSPWLAYGICLMIPGKREEPYVLSVNLALSALGTLCLAGYLAYASNVGGWRTIATRADVFLLFAPPYHLITSLWLSKRRLPLSEIPAFRVIEGVIMMGGVYLVLSWLARRVYIIFFSFIPFNAVLIFLAVLLAVAYVGYVRMLGDR